MPHEQLLGVWKLLSYEFRLSGGMVIRPMGQGVQGILMYDPSGWMSLQIIDPERPKFATNDWMSGTPEEAKAALDGLMAYYGTFELNEHKGTVVHHIQGSSFPNWCGIDREQSFELKGNYLTLMTVPTALSGEQVVGHLSWERIR